MNCEISKELLSEVLKENIVEVYKIGSNPNFERNTLLYKLYRCGDICSVNIYELVHKCKEWAIKENRENKTINNGDHFYVNHIGSWMIGYFENYQCDVGYRGKDKDGTFADLTKHFTADTEQQAVFDACQWILDNKDKQ